MSTTLSTLPFLFALLLPTAQDEGESKEELAAKKAVAELTEVFKKGEPGERAAAIQRAAEVDHEDVVKAIAKGFRDKSTEVLTAAIYAMRTMQHEDALKQLHSQAKGNKAIKAEPELFEALIKGIGQHRDESSIPVLTSKVFNSADTVVTRARILALGHIRSVKSVEALFDLMKLVGRNQVQKRMGEFRLALVVLTGVDRGNSQEAWLEWWGDNRKGLEISGEEPKMSKTDTMRWNNYWDRERIYDRAKKRGDRGKDPEGGGGA